MNNVLPGFIDSRPETSERRERIPLGRYGHVGSIRLDRIPRFRRRRVRSGWMAESRGAEPSDLAHDRIRFGRPGECREFTVGWRPRHTVSSPGRIGFPKRFVVEIVDRLDLSELERAYRGRGKTPYHPSVPVALLFYGYATGVFASRHGPNKRRTTRRRFDTSRRIRIRTMISRSRPSSRIPYFPPPRSSGPDSRRTRSSLPTREGDGEESARSGAEGAGGGTAGQGPSQLHR